MALTTEQRLACIAEIRACTSSVTLVAAMQRHVADADVQVQACTLPVRSRLFWRCCSW
jgi:hypothetical protein